MIKYAYVQLFTHTCMHITHMRIHIRTQARLQVNVSAPHPAATQCHIVASVYFSFHYITYRNIPCQTIPYQIIPTTHTHNISLVTCIKLHKCMNACVHYSMLYKLLSVTYITDIQVTHTHAHSTPHYLGTYHTYTTHQTYFAYQTYIAQQTHITYHYVPYTQDITIQIYWTHAHKLHT